MAVAIATCHQQRIAPESCGGRFALPRMYRIEQRISENQMCVILLSFLTPNELLGALPNVITVNLPHFCQFARFFATIKIRQFATYSHWGNAIRGADAAAMQRKQLPTLGASVNSSIRPQSGYLAQSSTEVFTRYPRCHHGAPSVGCC